MPLGVTLSFLIAAPMINEVAATLLLVALGIWREAWGRFIHPEPVLVGPMLVIAVVGLVVNLAVALALREHDHHDLNVRSAFLHVLGDALASVGVIAAGGAIALTGWTPADPLVSVLIGLIILLGGGRVLLQSVHILAEGMPEVLLTRGMGAGAYESIAQAGIRPILTDIAEIEQAVQAYVDGRLVDHPERLH